MRKKLLILVLATVVGISSIPIGNIFASVSVAAEMEDDSDAWDDEEKEEEEPFACVFIRPMCVVSPAKKTIKVGKSFTIKVCPRAAYEREYEDLSKEEWDDLIEDMIDEITFRSTKKSVASVNSKGKVKGKKKGSAIIKTTITFRDGSESIYKTKVYVK